MQFVCQKKEGPARISWKNEQVEQKRKVQELLKSDGWGNPTEDARRILSAAYQMAENKMLTIDEINLDGVQCLRLVVWWNCQRT